MPNFAKSKRLLTSVDFRSTFKGANKIYTPWITFYLKKNALERARLGIIVTKKRVKLAVLRNKIKRITREQFRFVQTELTGWDIIVMVNCKIDKTQLNLFDKHLREPWQKLRKYYQKV